MKNSNEALFEVASPTRTHKTLHAWVIAQVGPTLTDIVDGNTSAETLTVWECDNCECKVVGPTIEGPTGARECYWLDGKGVERQPWEFWEQYGDPPVDGSLPPPPTCEEVRARALALSDDCIGHVAGVSQ